MNIQNNRRSNLKEWFSKLKIPEAEKSYISQLINGRASFGEKAARRLESTYGMPCNYLDIENNQPNSGIADQIDLAMRSYKPYPMSQAELSRLSGVPQPTISRTLKGLSIPSTETLEKIAKTLGITFANFSFQKTGLGHAYESLSKSNKEKADSYIQYLLDRQINS